MWHLPVKEKQHKMKLEFLATLKETIIFQKSYLEQDAQNLDLDMIQEDFLSFASQIECDPNTLKVKGTRLVLPHTLKIKGTRILDGKESDLTFIVSTDDKSELRDSLSFLIFFLTRSYS